MKVNGKTDRSMDMEFINALITVMKEVGTTERNWESVK